MGNNTSKRRGKRKYEQILVSYIKKVFNSTYTTLLQHFSITSTTLIHQETCLISLVLYKTNTSLRHFVYITCTTPIRLYIYITFPTFLHHFYISNVSNTRIIIPNLQRFSRLITKDFSFKIIS